MSTNYLMQMGIMSSSHKDYNTLIEDLDQKMKQLGEARIIYTEKEKRRQQMEYYIGAAYAILIAASIWYNICIVANLLIGILLGLYDIFLKFFINRKICAIDKEIDATWKQKQLLLEEVKRRETYSNAKMILDKYGDISPILPVPTPTAQETPARPSSNALLSVRPTSNFLQPATPVRPTPTPAGTMQATSASKGLRPEALPFRPVSKVIFTETTPSKATLNVLPAVSSTPNISKYPEPVSAVKPESHSSKFMRFLAETLIGETEEDRTKLICRYCQWHSAIVARAEAEYLDFYCPRCMRYNPAMKVRPVGPKLMPPLLRTNTL